MTGALFMLAGCTTRPAARPLRIYIMTDLEGASGVYQFAQSRDTDEVNGDRETTGPGRRSGGQLIVDNLV